MNIQVSSNEILLTFLEDRRRAYDFLRDAYKAWKSLENDHPMFQIASILVAVSISLMDLHEATINALLTVDSNSDNELDFVSKTASRMLALRVFEQEKALHRFRKSIEKMVMNDRVSVDYSKFDHICKINRNHLAYARNLRTIRNEIGHYNDNHAYIIDLVEQIDPVKLVESSGAIIRCYTALSDVIGQVQNIKLTSIKIS